MTKRLAAAGLLLVLAGCAVPSEPIPQESGAAGQIETSAEAEADTGAEVAEVSTCDRVRESFLTGTKAEQVKALKQLKADRGADGTAREYAGYWLGRDKGEPDMQEMDQSLIVSLCS